MVATTVTFLTPRGALLAAAALVPLAASAWAATRNARGRALLRLESQSSDRLVAAVAAIPLLLGFAAAQPVVRTHVGRRIRTDAQAIFVFDTSRSMAAAAAAGAPTRMRQAKAAAIRLRRDAIPDVPSGVASLTTQLLPHLFPTSAVAAFASTVEHAIGVEKPSPPALQFGLLGTSFQPLGQLRDQGFFTPWAKERLAVLLTDGESGPYDPESVGDQLVGPSSSTSFIGTTAHPEAPVRLVIIRFGHSTDRIYESNGSFEAAYRPDPGADRIVLTLASSEKGRVFDTGQLGEAARTMRALLGTGPAITRGVRTRNIELAPYVVLAALPLLGLVAWKRNLTAF
jgi:hypothetical protein